MDEKTLNALVNAIKNKDPKGLKAYENLQKIASSKPKNEEEQKNIEAAKGYVAEIKKRLTAIAAHGAKLDYVKSLKHICPEGQELVYFKKGGSVKCGCVGKKLEEGAKVKKDATGAVARFKSGKNVVVNGSTKQPMLNAMAKQEAERKVRIERDRKSLEDYEKGFTDHGDNPPDSEAMAKNRTNKQSQGKGIRFKAMAMDKKGGSVVDKFKKAKCGSKMKKK